MHNAPVEQRCTWSIRVSSEKTMSYQLGPQFNIARAHIPMFSPIWVWTRTMIGWLIRRPNLGDRICNPVAGRSPPRWC